MSSTVPATVPELAIVPDRDGAVADDGYAAEQIFNGFLRWEAPILPVPPTPRPARIVDVL